MFNPMNWFKRDKNDMEFLDNSGYCFKEFPIQLAKNVPLSMTEIQKESSGKLKFHLCPGMIDYARYGYIIPAWETIKVKANKAGTVAFHKRKQTTTSQPVPMDSSIIEGVFKPQDGIKLEVWKSETPWKIHCNKDISAFVLPAVFHSNFLDDLHVYPGVVDYKSFRVVNFIYSAKRECEVTIKPGEPLLHVLPFYNKPISAGYGETTLDEYIGMMSPIYDIKSHLYRKRDSIKKIFNLDPKK